MSRHSARSPWSIRTWLLLAGVGLFFNGAWAVQSELSGAMSWRMAGRFHQLDQLLSNRSTLELDQVWRFGDRWLLEVSGRAELEGAWASESEFGGRLSELDTQHFFWRDTYLQFKEGPVRARFGYQQVVWGEAFGSFYADIVNPKDMRELGLGELTDQRLQLPMLNVQLIKAKFSVQAIYILKPDVNLPPIEGSPYLPKDIRELSSNVLVIEREPEAKLDVPEYGLRLSRQLGEFDLSLLFFDHYDRQAVYDRQIESLAPLAVRLLPIHERVQSFGATLSAEVGDYLLRSEVVLHKDRPQNTVDAIGALSRTQADEWIYVFGLDIPTNGSWNTGVQFAESILEDDNYLNRQHARQSTATWMLQKTFKRDWTAALLISHILQAGGSLTQFNLTKALSRRLELVLGADVFEGHQNSQLGQFTESSRASILLKGYLK